MKADTTLGLGWEKWERDDLGLGAETASERSKLGFWR